MKTYLPTLTKEKFNKLSINSRRVAICKDVIARIKAKNIQSFVKDGLIAYSFKYDILYPTINRDSSAQCFINENKCEGCAKGALVFSWIGNFNKYSIKKLLQFNVEIERFPEELVEIFGVDLLNSIEVAFEQSAFRWSGKKLWNGKWNGYNEIPTNFAQSIIKTFKKYKNPNNRLIAIMQNIIDNKGILKTINGEKIK